MTTDTGKIARAWALDENGFFIVDLFDHDPNKPDFFTVMSCPSGVFRKPKFVNGEWMEGLAVSAQEILEKEKLIALSRVNKSFQDALAYGVVFAFNETADIVQTRDQRDLINISGVASRAMILHSQGVTDPVINFRALSNTTYQLTPAQAIQLGEFVALKIEQLYGILWSLKDAVIAAATVQDVESIAWPE